MVRGNNAVPAPGEALSHLDPHQPWHVVHSGTTVLVTNPDGTFDGDAREGLWFFAARILSRHRVMLAGVRPLYHSASIVESDRWTAHLGVPRPGGSAAGPLLPEDTLELVLSRRVGHGMVEELSVHNYSQVAAEADLVLELDADFADMKEALGDRRQQGALERTVEPGGLRFDYRAEHEGRHLHRALRVRVARSDSEPQEAGPGSLRFRLRLPPHGRWQATLHYEALASGVWSSPATDGADVHALWARQREDWRASRPRLEDAHPLVGPAFDQAAEDLFALRNHDLEAGPGMWVLNAGIPAYTGLFGRDIVTASWQGALLGPEMLRGALQKLAETQATDDSPWHDREPGKLIHQSQRGPLEELEITPFGAYYGTVTTPAMFVLALSEYWHWTADDSLLRRYRDVALRTFDWVDRHGDVDGDGFIEYRQRSPAGLKNHGWKDSDEAIRYEDGRLVENPIATVEEQAFHYLALQRMAEVLVALGEDGHAERFLDRARRLRSRFNGAFWLEEEGFYAMALDPEKRPVRSIGSNPGHALATGLVPRGRARIVADRLLAPDLFSGWGVRTLSTGHPSYNPYAYHLGSVWPVENATFALGMKRYGLDDHADRIIDGLFTAAAHFERLRLPELLGGHAHGEVPAPTNYPRANSPQAWSASATIQMAQIMLGLYPFAPASALAIVRPRLPAWLPRATVRNLRIGNATVSIRFERQRDGTTGFDIVEKEGRLHVVAVPPPQDASAEAERPLDRVKGWVLEHAPGRALRALRIALGEDAR